jgi:hypothetical protein
VNINGKKEYDMSNINIFVLIANPFFPNLPIFDADGEYKNDFIISALK